MPCLTSVLAVPMGATGTLQKAASLNSFSGRGVSDGAFAGGWKLLDAAARIRFSSSTSSRALPVGCVRPGHLREFSIGRNFGNTYIL